MTDIGFFLANNGAEFLVNLLNSPYVEIAAEQLRVNSIVHHGDGQTCRFHHPEIGCRIPMAYRNTVCRQFLCPAVKLWQDPRARRWVGFWLKLQEEEIRQQQLLSAECLKRGCSLSVRRQECLQLLGEKYSELKPDDCLPGGYPETEILLLDWQHRKLAALTK